VTGHVTDAEHPNGAPNICVGLTLALSERDDSPYGWALSDSNGDWVITGHFPTSNNYRVIYNPGWAACGSVPSPDLDQLYKGLGYSRFLEDAFNGTPVSVEDGVTTSGIDDVLLVGGTITGQVTDASHPGGLPGVCVSAYPSSPSEYYTYGSGTATTDSNGNYSLDQLTEGPYEIEFDPTCNGTITSPDRPQSYGATVPVQLNTSTPGIDVKLGAMSPTATTGIATAQTASGAELHATVNPNGTEVTECKFEYGTTNGPYEASVPCSPAASELGSGESPVAVSAAVTGLTPKTTYHFRIVATNASATANGVDAIVGVPLTVAPLGKGSGTITGPGIDCGNGATECEHVYPAGEVVTLTPHPTTTAAPASSFAGWGDTAGVCRDATPTCEVTLTEAPEEVLAAFGEPGSELFSWTQEPQNAPSPSVVAHFTPGASSDWDCEWTVEGTTAAGEPKPCQEFGASLVPATGPHPTNNPKVRLTVSNPQTSASIEVEQEVPVAPDSQGPLVPSNGVACVPFSFGQNACWRRFLSGAATTIGSWFGAFKTTFVPGREPDIVYLSLSNGVYIYGRTAPVARELVLTCSGDVFVAPGASLPISSSAVVGIGWVGPMGEPLGARSYEEVDGFVKELTVGVSAGFGIGVTFVYSPNAPGWRTAVEYFGGLFEGFSAGASYGIQLPGGPDPADGQHPGIEDRACGEITTTPVWLELAKVASSLGIKLPSTAPPVSAGAVITVSGSGMTPNTGVNLSLHSTPVSLGETQANDDGAFEAKVWIPTDTSPGEHEIIAEGEGPSGTQDLVSTLQVTAPAAPANQGLPEISGAPAPGTSLSCSEGSWSGQVPILAYQWLRDGSDIAEATESTYTVQSADQGHGLECEVTATNGEGEASARSAAVQIPVALPSSSTSAPASPSSTTSAPATAASGGVLGAKAAHASVSLVGSTITVQRGGEATIKLSCAGTATCSGKLTLTAKSVTGKGKNRRTKTENIATAPLSIPAGKTVSIKLKLNETGRALLSAAHGRLDATLTILKTSPSPRNTQAKSVHLSQQKAKKSKK